MILTPSSATLPSPEWIEGGLTLIGCAVAFAWPRVCSRWFQAIERGFGRLARRRALAAGVVALSAFLLRLALLPLCPIPLPIIPDDFSFLLAADTFAAGRLTNPTPALWTHFESIHVTMQPTYMSMYFPAQGMVLAAGKVLTGIPWIGTLCITSLMCGAVCWMLQAWLPPSWALLGGLLAVLRIGLFSYWINTYTGGGSVAALGGALVLGALPRFMRSVRSRDGLVLAAGMVVLANSRAYEGFLLCIPIAIVLGRWALAGKKRPSGSLLLRRCAAPLALLIAAGSWMAWYNYRAFGNPLTEPYTINRATYAMAPYFVWQDKRPEPAYRHEAMRRFYYRNELIDFDKIHSRSGFAIQTAAKAIVVLQFFAGFALLPPLILMRRVVLDRRVRFLVVCLLVLMAGMLIEIYLLAYYVAPFTVVFYALGLQAMRHLRQWKPGGQPVGKCVVRLAVAICIAAAAIRTTELIVRKSSTALPLQAWSCESSVASQCGFARAHLESELAQLPEKQLVVVRYTHDHDPMNEWVYNAADIDGSKVIWAREMDPANDVELMRTYKDRTAWLVEPDKVPVQVTHYMLPEVRKQADGGAGR